MEDVREILATNLKKARSRARISQEALAHDAKVDRTYVSGIERKVRNPTIEIVARFAEVLGTTSATLLTRDAFVDKAD